MTTVIMNNNEIDNNVYESLFMQAEVLDDIITFAGTIYGNEGVEKIIYGDLNFTKRVTDEYWQSILN